jgi:hypothetical protein
LKDTKADFFIEIFFPKNWSFSESLIKGFLQALVALRVDTISCSRKKLKSAQNYHVSIKNAEFLYKIPQIEVDYTKNRPH